ncbi:complement decay-accelerating factor isoform X2 [Chanos chanos]|uniref:Complement decay-accelerating factor isoform X2 n=1 Tax=Chanos chanos TaxID=29144 RepID=A0A6J2VKL4_CHACN|nr:complement decay-accelerating factor-like isoform X2 [Chanos chanos]
MTWERLLLSAVTLSLILTPSKGAECEEPTNLEGNVVLTDDARLKNNFPSGTIITLECANGYVTTDGSTNTITCTNGKWSKVELDCKKKDCGQPKDSPNLRYEVQTDTLFGSYIRAVCDTGYELQGPTFRQCLATGWVGRPRCVLVTCKSPPEIENSVISGPLSTEDIKFNDTIEYSCKDGYTFNGSSSIYCDEHGKYSKPLPVCVEQRTTTQPNEATTAFSPTETEQYTEKQPDEAIKTTAEGRPDDHSTSQPTQTAHTNDDMMMIVTVVIVICVLCVLLFACVSWIYSKRGSYTTGEDLRTKEELLLDQCQSVECTPTSFNQTASVR